MSRSESTTSLIAGSAALGVLLALFLGSGRFKLAWPLRGRISSPFGPRINPITGKAQVHGGLDIVVPVGTPVRASAAGTVVKLVSADALAGRYLILEHIGGYRTSYLHLSKTSVVLGQSVTVGQVIGLSGQSGRTTGPHLHLALRNPAGQFIDPTPYLV